MPATPPSDADCSRQEPDLHSHAGKDRTGSQTSRRPAQSPRKTGEYPQASPSQVEEECARGRGVGGQRPHEPPQVGWLRRAQHAWSQENPYLEYNPSAP